MELPMSLSMHAASVPVFRQMLAALAGVLAKAETHASERKIDPVALLQARLFPDMFPLARQVQIATDMAKGGAARLAGVEIPSFPDTESSFPELQERLTRTIAFLKSIKPAQLEGSEQREVNLQMRMGAVTFTGQYYLLSWVMPNVYFHVTTAYNILRHNGVELGKWDFLGKAPGANIKAGKPAKKPAKKRAPRKA